MYAIIETGGKQYRVQNGDRIKVEKLNVEDGQAVVFDKVLVAGEGADVKIGAPYVEGFTVEGKAVESGKGDKVIIFKYKAKKDYRKKQGHRQPYTMVEITAIGGEKAPAAPVEEAKAEVEETKKHKSIKSMKKAELIAFAAEQGIEIDEKATNAVMIETIEAAMK